MKQGRRPSRDKTSVKVTHKEPKENRDYRENYKDIAPGYSEFKNNAEIRFQKKRNENKESKTVSLSDVITILKGRPPS
jgi:hypothetical protein